MITPIDPIEPPVSPTATAPTAFSATLKRSAMLRVGVVLAAALVLLVSAALAFGASPAPSGAAPQASQPAPGGSGAPRLRDRGLGGPGFRFNLGGGRLGFGAISITAIDGSNVSLKTEDGWTRTIAVTGTTKLTRAGAAIALAELKVGDRIRFHETRNADGTFAIDRIDIVLPSVVGEVTAKTADTITVEPLGGGSATIHVGASTTYRVAGKANATLADIAVGAIIGAAGQQRADGSIDAATVRAAPKAGRWFGGRDGAGAKPKKAPKATPNATPGSYTPG
jgi:uncharacterized protein DUF5666